MNSDYFTNPQKAQPSIITRRSNIAVINALHVQANLTIQELSDSRSEFTISSKTSSSFSSQPIIRTKTKTLYQPPNKVNLMDIRRASQ